jgi:hypothetical protein
MNAITLSLRVTATTRASARVSTGRRQFSIGRPVEFDEASAHVSALEYALGAVGGEIVNGLREFARRRRIEIDAIEALVSGDLYHALTYLEVVAETQPPRLGRIAVKIFVSTADEAAIRALFPELLDRLPLTCTLRPAVDVTTELIVTP